MEQIKLTFEEIVKHLPDSITLYYVDYRDSFSNNLDSIQEAIHSGNYDSLSDNVDWDDWDEIKHCKKELENTINNFYDIDYADELIEEYDDEIRDVIYDRDDSTPINDMLNNTGEQTMFYDTGHYVDEGSWSWNEARIRLTRMEIKQVLGIIKENQYNSVIDMMIRQASYGGRLVIYFYENVKDFIGDEERNCIQFDNANVAIIDNGNGSGDHTHLPGSKIILPFNRENIFLDKNVSYSYTFEVCGMYANWCEGTRISLIDIKGTEKPKRSNINDYLAREAELDRIFAEGGCTFGDMNINRHKDTPYINEFPCGNKCTKCGTFWVD